MKKIILNTCFAAGTVLILSGCSSSRKITETAPSAPMPRELVAVSHAVEPVSPKETKSVLDAVASRYTPWYEVMLDGKLSMKGLPIDPSAKIYMLRDKQVIISVRAPIMGEVARIEITDTDVVMANRLKKIYSGVPTDRFLSKVDMTVGDVQDILMGRIFVMGQGVLGNGNADSMVVTEAPSDSWIITPLRQPANASYGFTVTPDYQLQILFAESADGRYQASAEYEWKGDDGRKDVVLTVMADDRTFVPEFSFKAPDFSPKPLSRFVPGNGWKQVSLREFMTSF